jgi:hypothetical protein
LTFVYHLAFSFISASRVSPELSNAVAPTDTSGSMFVQFMFMDEACLSYPHVLKHISFHCINNRLGFHCAIAVSVTALNKLVIKQEDPTEAMRHLSQVFRLVNTRLSGASVVSNTTIAAILMMVQHERILRRYRQGFIHLAGLQRMVELRGGMYQFNKDEPYLARKIFR